MAKTWPPKQKQWQPPKQPPVVQPGSGNSTLINPCQRLNLVTEYICNMPKEFGDILLDYPCDYKVGGTDRTERLGQACKLRLLLLMFDIHLPTKLQQNDTGLTQLICRGQCSWPRQLLNVSESSVVDLLKHTKCQAGTDLKEDLGASQQHREGAQALKALNVTIIPRPL
ncbi:hypothetical protein EDB85DRAFT_1894710 [Lactarius pseudohatsudake]|nr:hypothetical protein EDB85DRAFT_1894710 [Lactarius pseudohatsudake]